MGKNLIPEVAKLLGLETGEEFKLKGLSPRWIYKFTEDSFLCKFNNFEWSPAYNVLDEILDGTFEIVKLPWEPKRDELYYWPSASNKKVGCGRWHGDTFCCAMKALGMVYRTEAEALEHFTEDYERLTSKKWEG